MNSTGNWLHPILLLTLLAMSDGIQAAGPCGTIDLPPRSFFVMPNGSDLNLGTGPSNAEARRTVQAGVDCLAVAGDVLRIAPGVYTEFVTINNKNGTPARPIRIEKFPQNVKGEVIIQGSITDGATTGGPFKFHHVLNQEWQPAIDVGTIADEYVSKRAMPPPANLPLSAKEKWFVNRGAFVSPVNGRYTASW